MAQEEGTEPPPPPAPPQEEPAPEVAAPRTPKVFFQVDMWYMQPAGTEYFVATEFNPTSPLETRVWDVAHTATWRPRYVFAYALDNGAGEFSGTYFSQDQKVDLLRSSPGQFIYGEIQAYPLYAGVFDDGLADAFDATTRTKIREWRLDFSRSFMSGERVRGKWLAGWREVNHVQEMQVEYFALNPPTELFPPVTLPPAPGPRSDLIPFSDEATQSSTYGGRGPEVGVEFLFPFGKAEKFVVEAGATYALLRGDLTQSYASFVSFYGVYQDGVLVEILTPPYDEFLTDSPSSPSIRQTTFSIGRQVQTAQISGNVLDAYLGFRWKPWKELEVVGGFRSSSYDSVGAFVRPSTPASATSVVNTQTLEKQDLRVLYEGFYAGIAYRF